MSEIERAIEQIKDHMRVHRIGQYPHVYIADALNMALDALKEKLEREKNPLTWNERINQMTVEEKATWLYDMDVCRLSSISVEECNSYRHCTECMKNMLNSAAEVGK